MTAISIFREEVNNEPRYSAFANAGGGHGAGKTPGEALDALKLGIDESAEPIVIVLQPRPENAFTEDQVTRLRSLIAAAKTSPLAEDDQAEMEALIDPELNASAQFASAVASALGR